MRASCASSLSNTRRTDRPCVCLPQVRETVRLRSQGWRYTLHASFMEIHNEAIHDLLSAPGCEAAMQHDHTVLHDADGNTTVRASASATLLSA